MNVALRNRAALPAVYWWEDRNMVSLVKRTAARDCNTDEFDEFTAVAKELKLNPLRKQIYAFVFNKDDDKKRNMAIVVGIDGGRSIAARSGNYRPDHQPPTWEISEAAKNPLTNPHGIVSCTVGVFHRPTKNDPFERIVAQVFWDEFAPIVKSGDDDSYEWVDTGEVWADTGKPKKRKKLIQGATVELRLDPRKDQWIKGGRHKIALCAEMQALRRGWPEDMSRLYTEEETDKARTLEDVEYSDQTPSQMAAQAEADSRMERIGGPALFAIFSVSNDLERVPHGQFADRVLAHTERMAPADVAAWVEKNTAALKEFWAHNKTDCLALKKQLETRSAGVGASPQRPSPPADKAAPVTASPSPLTAKAGTGAAHLSKDELIAGINKLATADDFTPWAEQHGEDLETLSDPDRREVEKHFNNKSGALSRAAEKKN